MRLRIEMGKEGGVITRDAHDKNSTHIELDFHVLLTV